MSGHLFTSSKWYNSVHDVVNNRDVVQLGIVFAYDYPSPESVHTKSICRLTQQVANTTAILLSFSSTAIWQIQQRFIETKVSW
jgi:hypothetical protein